MGGRVLQAATLAACRVLTVAGVAGCQLATTPKRQAELVSAAAEPASLLVLVIGAPSRPARAAFREAVLGTARPDEELVVLNTSGTTLGSYRSPVPPVMTGPVFPAPLAANATSFQRAAYKKSRAHAEAALQDDRHLLSLRARQSLLAWANSAVSKAWASEQRQRALRPGLSRSVVAAMADVMSLQQAGLTVGTREALGIIEVSGLTGSPATLTASLAGMTVAVTGVQDVGADAAWQAGFLGAGASRAYVLPAALGALLPGLISGALSGHDVLPFSLTGFTYGPAQYALPRAATPSLDRLLHLLTVTYPSATASINGYTDGVPVPGGNQALSWKRADAVLSWLVAHGVAAGRLEAIGHGAVEPVSAGAQPRDRRVVVIVTPGG